VWAPAHHVSEKLALDTNSLLRICSEVVKFITGAPVWQEARQ
jgi:hypothetical protein